ncbi:MAG: TonB-dependent receptor [Bacteroidales bacterium]|nr:TonB-dependent receptor [Bacteroidales bacterium]
MKTLLLILAIAPVVPAQPQDSLLVQDKLDSVVVSATRAGLDSPVTFTMIGKAELSSKDPSASLPMNLALQPGVVVWNEGGTGLGNSSMTIRGSKGSQINVTLTGITLNDAESQEVFWVNIPAITGLLSSVQVQRGLGTSASGSGAFGASINMSTSGITPSPSFRFNMSGGAWNTFTAGAYASTGHTKSGFWASAAYSRAWTDGYVRGGKVSSQAAFANIGWMKGSNSVRLTWLLGQQKSGITWDGIDLETYKTDRRYNSAGEHYDAWGNRLYYDNQTDNYLQNHIQLNYTHQFTSQLSWSNTLNYTYGYGYDEYYGYDLYGMYGYGGALPLASFGFPEGGVKGVDGAMHESGETIHRMLMRNHYFVYRTDLKYVSHRIEVTAGGSVSCYLGDHWGKVLWVDVLGDDYDYSRNSWYFNDAVKWDADIYARVLWRIVGGLSVYADLQGRYVDLRMKGPDNDFTDISCHRQWPFFNPRAGVTWTSGGHKVYAFAALGHREPGRGDIKENVDDIRPEIMVDAEAGWSWSNEKLRFSADIYAMEYKDMLIETGRISASGYMIKENVPRSWRRGVELTAGWTPGPWLSLDGNVALSINQIRDYTAYVPYDDYSAVKSFHYGRTPLMMSPSVVGMLRFSLSPWAGRARHPLRSTTLTADWKIVGKQYLDNTGREDLAVPSYNTANLSLSHSFSLPLGSLELSVYVTNVFNSLYYASGWRSETWNPGTETLSTFIGIYPQAPVAVMGKICYSF